MGDARGAVHWRRGTRRALVDTAIEALRDTGYATAALWVLELNARVRVFYEAAGWRAAGASKSNDYGGVQLAGVAVSDRVMRPPCGSAMGESAPPGE